MLHRAPSPRGAFVFVLLFMFATLGRNHSLRAQQQSDSELQFSAGTYAARETDPSVTITVVRTGSIASAVSVNYSTSDTTGGAGVRYTPVSGTLTFAVNDAAAKTFTVPIINDAVQDGDQVVQLTLSNPTSPATLGTLATASLTILDDESPTPSASAAFTSDNYSAREDAGSVGIVVVRTDDGSGRVAVSYSTANGSTNAAGRYAPTSGTLIFEAGDLSPRVVSIPLVDNAKIDGDATVALSLKSTADSPVDSATLTIVDDDAQPATLPTTFQFTTSVFTALETDGAATITVTRAGGPAAPFSASGGQVKVGYFVTDLDGRLGVDYTGTFTNPTSGTLVWGANDFTPKTFSVVLLRDARSTSDTRLGLTITSPQSFTDTFGNVIIPASLGNPSQATLLIVDADQPATLQFGQSVYQTFENVGAAVVNVTRTGGNGTPVAVAYRTGGGTAAAGMRYSAASGTLAWAAGDSTLKSIVIPILQDNIVEPDQTVGLTLGQIQGNAVLGGQSTATLLITDDDGGQFFPVLSADSSAGPVATTDGKTKGFFTIIRRDRLGNVPNLDLPLTVSYAARGTAANGVEYRFLSGVAIIPAGQDSVQIKVKAINGGGGHQSSVKLAVNPAANYFVNPNAVKAKIKIVLPGTTP